MNSYSVMTISIYIINEASENKISYLMHGSLDVLHISICSELVNVHENSSPLIKLILE